MSNRKKRNKWIKRTLGLVGLAFLMLSIVAKKKRKASVYENEPEQKNALEGKRVIFVSDERDKENADGVRGHLEAVGECNRNPGIYEKYIKRGLDLVLSFGALVLLSPVMGIIACAIYIEDPGPVLFTQKRLGQNKKYFKLHKFRSMKMNTPHDVPTHMLEHPEQYITKVGKFIREHSLDELPQIWDIFLGNMSIIGPRPGLWNQDLLTAERDKYAANDVKPGLTGWAQINGRDELSIPDKAALDGIYVEQMGPGMDAKVFLGSLHVFGKDESVVEGRNGGMKTVVGRNYTSGKTEQERIGHIGLDAPVHVDKHCEKHVLITGAGSYIGRAVTEYAKEHYPSLLIEELDMMDSSWREVDFSKYDIVYHVAGLAHADVGKVEDATKEKYYAVNTDLAVEVCEKAKRAGVKEFIFMSSMIIYGDSAPYGKRKVIDANTVPKPGNFYGDSKLQADVAVRGMASETFHVVVLRPPMIYGKGSKGNYPIMSKFARRLPIFPRVENRRSMIHIDNFAEFMCLLLSADLSQKETVLIPQNAEYTNTSEMVQKIARSHHKKIRLMGGVMKIAVLIGSHFPGKIGGIVNKAFGNYVYDQSISNYAGLDYIVVNLEESVCRTEEL